MWKRSTVRIMRHRQTKGPGTDRPDLHHRATSRLHTNVPSGAVWRVSKAFRGSFQGYTATLSADSSADGANGVVGEVILAPVRTIFRWRWECCAWLRRPKFSASWMQS